MASLKHSSDLHWSFTRILPKTVRNKTKRLRASLISTHNSQLSTQPSRGIFLQTTNKVPKVAGTTEGQIAVHWREEEYYKPSEAFIAQANLTDPAVNKRFAEKNFPDCFIEYADMLTWSKRWNIVLNTNHPPFWKWFVGGKLNASYNCVDRHLVKYKNKAALISVPEPEDEEPVTLTYQELYVRVNEFAALLRDFAGLKLSLIHISEPTRLGMISYAVF